MIATCTPALFRWRPALRAHFAHVDLGVHASPLEPLRLADLPPGAPAIWIKRDDQCAPRYGGNKARKLSFLMARLRQDGARAVWTLGAVGSHHALATAIYGQALGFDVHILHVPQPPTDHVRDNLLALSATRASLQLADKPWRTPRALTRLLADPLRRWGARHLAAIPIGGSNIYGVLGMVSAALELAAQVQRGDMPEPARLYVAAGSGGTFAGLWLGCRLAQLKTEVIGVRVADWPGGTAPLAAGLIARTSAALRRACPDLPRLRPAPWQLHFQHDHLGDGYGASTRDAVTATARFAEHGLTLDPTYTSKVAAAALRDLRRARLATDRPILIWHTLPQGVPDALVARADPDRLPAPYRVYTQHGASMD